MASTYSTDLRLELIGSGEQSGVWGSTTNLNLGSLVEQAVAGVETIAIASANQALTAFYGAVDESRNAVLVLSSGAAANVYVPPVSKVYVVKNAGSYAITMYNSTVLGNTTAAGTGLAVAAGSTLSMFTDGTDFYASGAPTNYTVSPTFTGVPLAPTASPGTNTTQIATTAFVTGALGGQSFASGTVLIFGQTAAPTGWTKDTTNYNNSALRVVTGTASTGGSVDFTTAFTSQTPAGSVSINTSGLSAGATTLTTPQIPSHTHSAANEGAGIPAGGSPGGASAVSGNTGATGGGGSHTHSVSGSATGSFTGTAINLAVKYVDVIRATKD